MSNKIQIFLNRMKKININIELMGNFPWVYINTINGKKVIEKFEAEHGFTIAFLPCKAGKEIEFTDLTKIFELIRKYK